MRFLLLLAVATPLFAQTTISGKASKTPWGGHWWTMRMGELALGWNSQDGRKLVDADTAADFTNCLTNTSSACKKTIAAHIKSKGIELSPMMKFDLWVKKQIDEAYEAAPVTTYIKATENELKIHYIDSASHRHAAAAGYAGKCTGWSMANMDYAEPTKTKTINGITFTPADIKGYLAAIYNGGQFFVPEDMILGEAFRGSGEFNDPKYYNDPAPHLLLQALEKHIKKEKKVIVADMDPGEGVWNHPIFAFDVKLAKPKADKVSGTMTLKYANDEVEIDEVFSTNKKRPDLITRELEFELTVPKNWNGSSATVTKSKWIGESKDKHPDSLVLGLESGWRKSINEYKNTDMKLEVNFQLIKKVNLGNGYKVMVDELLREYYK